jgi:dGTPase
MKNRFYGAFDYALVEERPGEPGDHRSPFQVDRDRVIFSQPFRRLQSKTQVFQSGEYDFYRTRLTHTIEVARIARSITEYLNERSPELAADFRIDPDLVEAVGLAHDLGHPPFGHIGERKLNQLMQAHGGFEGNAQTLRILSELIYPRRDQPRGMRSTRAFLDGVLKYKTLHREAVREEGGRTLYPANHFIYDGQAAIRDFVFDGWIPEKGIEAVKSIECQIMDWADDTAYSLHDIVDGVQARFITAAGLEAWRAGQTTLTEVQDEKLQALLESIRTGYYEPRIGRQIGEYVRACRLVAHDADHPLAAKSHRHRYRLAVEPSVAQECALYKRIAVDLIFKSAPLQQIEFKGGFLLEGLFRAYETHYLAAEGEEALRILPPEIHRWMTRLERSEDRYRLICDHLAAMTDSEALRMHRRLFDADFASIADLV